MTMQRDGIRAKTMHGARGLVYQGGELKGVFMDVSWQVGLENRPVETLGAFAPHEIVTVGQSPVTISASGWRPVHEEEGKAAGPHVDAGVPYLSQLLGLEGFTMEIQDRQTKKHILTATGLKSAGYRTRLSMRNLMDYSVDYIGLTAEDESGVKAEDSTAVVYPTGRAAE